MDLKESSISLLAATVVTAMNVESERTIYTVPAGKTLMIAFAFLEGDADLGDAGVVTMGAAGSATDFVGTTNVDNIDANDEYILIAPVPSATPTTLVRYPAGTVIVLDIATAANAVAGTCYLFGLLV